MIRSIFKKLLPPRVWNQLGIIKHRIETASASALQGSLEFAGYTIARKNDYYSPLPSVSQLKQKVHRWYRPSTLEGIEYDIEKMKAEFLGLLAQYYSEFSTYPAYEQLRKEGFGPGYTSLDALTLYMMIRHVKPRRYVEVGSGLSTYYCSLAAKRNASEGFPLQITCIEPHPYEKLYTIPGIEVISKEVQDLDTSWFRQLQNNDVFFIDSSHVVRIDGDVPFLFLEVLPTLNVGVVIHIHDVPFPYNFPYPPELWMFGQTWPLYWNEAMILQAFLCFNNKFKVEMSTPLMRHSEEAFLKQNVPFYESIDQNPNTFSSIWLRRAS